MFMYFYGFIQIGNADFDGLTNLYRINQQYSVYTTSNQIMQIEEMDQQGFPCFQIMIDEQAMIDSYILQDSKVLFPKVGFVINQSGIANILNPNLKINKVKIHTKDLKVVDFRLRKAGCVRRASYILNGNELVFAVKSINAELKDERSQLLKDLRSFLQGEDSQYLISFYTCFFRDGFVKLVLEYMDMGSLRRLIDLIAAQKIKLSEQEIATIMQKIILGLSHIHNVRKSIHRDIKPQNILFNSAGEVKITDFGVSKCIENTFGKSRVGTFIYMGPEKVDPKISNYSYKSDIWSLGIVFIELATGLNPFSIQKGQSVNAFKITIKILNQPVPQLPSNSFSQEMRNFLSKCLVKAQNERASTQDLLSDPWILSNKLPNLLNLIDRIRKVQ